MIPAFHQEMRAGLAGRESSLKMLPAFVSRPNGMEKGRFLSLDLGGTNCRVLEVELDGKRKTRIKTVKRWVVPQRVMKGSGTALFDFLADCLAIFLKEHPTGREYKNLLTFTFSFPFFQQSLQSGTLIRWTKGFTASGVEGRNVAVLLSEAIARKGLKGIRIGALTNDTVGTLMARSYADPVCDMGVIIGTGSNACYPEQTSRIKKLPAPGGRGEMIINMEWGNFDRLKSNRYDILLDRDSPNPGRQHLEKMVAGMYLGDIVRLVIREMIARHLWPSGPGRLCWGKPYSLSARDLSMLAEGKDPWEKKAEWDLSTSEREMVGRIGQIVALRSARIAASAILAVITWMDPTLSRKHTVAVDGALFEKYPGYQVWMIELLREIFGNNSENIRLVLTKDGSGIGAAIVGAVAAS